MKEHPPYRDLCSFEPILRFRPPSVGVPKSEPDKEEAEFKLERAKRRESPALT
jgi:hypothetical protein